MKKFLLALSVLLASVITASAENLPIPPVLAGTGLLLNIQTGTLELPFGSSETLGFNGNYLGPTIRYRTGETADIRINNNIGEDTTVHWHGMIIPAEFDGGPHQVIKAG